MIYQPGTILFCGGYDEQTVQAAKNYIHSNDWLIPHKVKIVRREDKYGDHVLVIATLPVGIEEE